MSAEAIPIEKGTEAVEITVELAKVMLGANYESNRHFNKLWGQELARRLREGEWIYNGDPIRFNKKGKLIDGQHRLWAVIETGIPIRAPIITDLDEEAFTTIDGGRSRSFSDVLGIKGHANRFALAACLRLLWKYKNRRFVGKNAHPTNHQMDEILQVHPDVSAHLAMHLRLSKFCSPTTLGALSYLTYRSSMNLTNEDAQWKLFWDRLNGVMAMPDDLPEYRYMDRLLTNRAKKPRLPQTALLQLGVRAWNLHAENRTVKLLKLDSNHQFVPDVLGYTPEQME